MNWIYFVGNTLSTYDENEIATRFSKKFVELPESIHYNITTASTDLSHLIPKNGSIGEKPPV